MIKTVLQKPFIRFAIIGCLGFLVDLISMITLSFWLAPMTARAGAFWFAATSNWLWNRTFTFNDRRKMTLKKMTHQWAHFIFCSGISFIPNWGCYYLLIHFLTPSSESALAFSLWPYLAMLPGIMIGLLLNYAFSRFWIFSNNTGTAKR